MEDILKPKEWEKFFELIDKIVNDGRPFSEKLTAVKDAAETNGSDVNLEEFVEWFDDRH